MTKNPPSYSIRHENTGTENSVRHIDTIKEMEALKLEYQIRCSHYELELIGDEKKITCIICGKNWYQFFPQIIQVIFFSSPINSSS